MSLLRFDLDTQRQLLSSLLDRSPRFTRPASSSVLFYPAFRTPSSSPSFPSVRGTHRDDPSRCWENRPTVLPTSLFSSFFLFSFLFSPRRRCHYRALAATFTRSLNRANNKRLFRLYSVLVNRTSMWNNRTIICSGCDTPRSFLPRDRVPRVQQLRYPILDYE